MCELADSFWVASGQECCTESLNQSSTRLLLSTLIDPPLCTSVYWDYNYTVAWQSVNLADHWSEGCNKHDTKSKVQFRKTMRCDHAYLAASHPCESKGIGLIAAEEQGWGWEHPLTWPLNALAQMTGGWMGVVCGAFFLNWTLVAGLQPLVPHALVMYKMK